MADLIMASLYCSDTLLFSIAKSDNIYILHKYKVPLLTESPINLFSAL
jgi:hypothetical protein